MPLLQLVIILVVVGVILWVINNYIPMQTTIKKILNAVVVIAVILAVESVFPIKGPAYGQRRRWLLNVFGIIGSLQGIHIGK